MREKIHRTITISFLIIGMLSGCITVVKKEESEQQAVTAPDLEATAKAKFGQEEADTGQSPAAPDVPDSPLPAPTATRYVPEGELAYYNFEGLGSGWETERAPGIIIRDPGTFGIEISVTGQNDYFMTAGVKDHPDGNISTYVINVSSPEESTAFVACRVNDREGEIEETLSMESAYIAQYRLDGAARLMKQVNGTQSVLADWVSGVSVNPEGVYNQLYLLCDESRILFMVNAQKVFDLQDTTLTVGDYAIGVTHVASGAETVIRFDKFSVYEP